MIRAPLVAGILAVGLAVAGAFAGRSIAEPELAGPTIAEATVALPLRDQVAASELVRDAAATREVPVGVAPAMVLEDVAAYLTAAASELDPASAAQRLAPRYGLTASPDACAAEPAPESCPPGAPGHIRGLPEPPSVPVVDQPQSTRPAAVFYAPTSDLVAVTVPHRAGETVLVYPNVLSGDEPSCDPVVTGYDRLVHSLLSVETRVDAAALAAADLDTAFTERTTFAFDINEGLTVHLCAQVSAPGAAVPDYSAEAIVETADRLVATVTITSVAGELVPGWSIGGYLPSGQPCGRFTVPGRSLYTTYAAEYAPSRVLCDLADIPGAAGGQMSPGRGVLPFSFGDRSSMTLEMAYGQAPSVRTSLALGRPATCTGACVVPEDEFYPIWGRQGAAVVRLTWVQGNSNGATTTRVGPISDTLTPSPPGPRLDVATADLRQTAFDVASRSAEATLTFRADEPADYVATLVSPEGAAPCQRPGFAPERRGTTGTAAASVVFTGLCAGADYRVLLELTDAAGLTTTWDAASWGDAALVHVREVLTPIEVQYRLASDAYLHTDTASSGESVYLTLRAGDLTLVGPHSGGCFPVESGIAGARLFPGGLALGETTRISGTIQSVPVGEGEGCHPDLPGAPLSLSFAFELSLDQLLASPDGVVIRVDQPIGADPSVRATASAIIRISYLG